VIYPGVAQQAPPAIQNRPKMAEPPYILTVGTIEPRKNIAFLVEIFEKMRAFKGRLVIAGRLGWKYSPILERLRASPRAADIRLLENVNDGELASLYAGAEAFVFPSLYEGFGFPPLEAAACGAPVVSSAAGSLREVLGNGALLIDKYDAGQWAEAVMGIINDVSRRRALVDRGRLQAARYTWAETARKTMELYRSLA
jgi:glycosyltransferase involved in cell wall biosynthesis